ncbi:hypothetical protein [Shewanella sp. DAU305]|uniref:hypothetical protein n=1 Tax=Shewanella sp. DAU305 TaxID=2991940 RepID=UPI00228352D7|nr:hypothetical protein [Shewanella sp. DAU305]WAL76949.1 hypothetical protein OX890_12260 [Shewanella sp. DAU305]
MQIETLYDVMQWTKNIHQQLHVFAAHCALENDSERSELLLEYISSHEKKMERVIRQFEDNGNSNSNALNTYCRHFYEKTAIPIHLTDEHPFEKMDTDEIAIATLEYHKNIVGLFEYLQNCSSAPSVTEFLSNILSLEEAEKRLLARNMKQIDDL